jgi:hypothetical protein
VVFYDGTVGTIPPVTLKEKVNASAIESVPLWDDKN